jgi:hypothetical protein
MCAVQHIHIGSIYAGCRLTGESNIILIPWRFFFRFVIESWILNIKCNFYQILYAPSNVPAWEWCRHSALFCLVCYISDRPSMWEIALGGGGGCVFEPTKEEKTKGINKSTLQAS